MRKLMILAAMLAMAMAVAVPAFAQQTSGAATSGGASLTAGDLANQCAQVANNVNSGNVSQEAAAVNLQTNIGALALLEQNIKAEGIFASVFNLGLLFAVQDVDQTVDQTASNEIAQAGITQVNNAKLECNQAIEQTKK